jgi:lipoprotein-releasing system permease protein
MLVIEKQKDISVLKAMGGNNSFIRNIFLGEGFLLSGIGVSSGMILALLLCYLQVKYKFIKLSGSSFLIDYYPVKVLPFDLIVIMATVCLITFIASWIPAIKASARPVELRSVD